MFVKLKEEYALLLGKGMGIEEAQMKRNLDNTAKLGHYVM